jgi:hypothetical protein
MAKIRQAWLSPLFHYPFIVRHTDNLSIRGKITILRSTATFSALIWSRSLRFSDGTSRKLALADGRALGPRITQGLRPVASRDDVAVVYLLRSAQYQFCDCGVF